MRDIGCGCALLVWDFACKDRLIEDAAFSCQMRQSLPCPLILPREFVGETQSRAASKAYIFSFSKWPTSIQFQHSGSRVIFKRIFFFILHIQIYTLKKKRIDPYIERGAMMTDMMLHGSLVSLRSCQLEILLAS